MTQETQTRALWQPRGERWGGRWKGGSRGRGIRSPMADSCRCMEEPTQYFKAIILQLKINTF